MAYSGSASNPGGAAGPKAHVYDLVSGDLASYIEQMSAALADGMMDNGHPPFSARLTRQQQEDFYYDKYADLIYTADNQPNEKGREALIDQFGPDAFAEIVRIVLRRRRREAAVQSPLLGYPDYADQLAGQENLDIPPDAPVAGGPQIPTSGPLETPIVPPPTGVTP